MNWFQRQKSLVPLQQSSTSMEEKSVQQVHVQSVKRAEVVLSDGSFASIHQLKLGHLLLASDDNEFLRAAKLITLAVRIDDKNVSLQDALNLGVSDFNTIMEQLMKYR